jgi:hypothetical protein
MQSVGLANVVAAIDTHYLYTRLCISGGLVQRLYALLEWIIYACLYLYKYDIYSEKSAFDNCPLPPSVFAFE